MPTGVALLDARQHLFAAAERVLLREGPSGLTSRAVTEEAGVAKGVLHRHFADFDDFLAELIRDRIAQTVAQAAALRNAAGRATVRDNLAGALTQALTPTALHMVALLSSRDRVRARLRETTPHGIPLLTETTAALAGYLDAERRIGRIAGDADTAALAFALVGTGHLLFAGEAGARPARKAVAAMIESVISGATA